MQYKVLLFSTIFAFFMGTPPGDGCFSEEAVFVFCVRQGFCGCICLQITSGIPKNRDSACLQEILGES
jgi:hypothetical protein